MTFPEFCRSHGAIPPPIIEPGKDYRVPTNEHPRKKNALIRLDPDCLGGIVINFESGFSAQQWKSGDNAKAEDRSKDNAALTERLARKRESERAATVRAKAEYDAATPILSAAHPYLQAKRIDQLGCRGLRVSGDNLLVPMFHRRNFSSLQRISPTGEKKYATGAPAKGCTFAIFRPRYSLTILCEGFATGATIFSASQICRVIVCFSADNLVTVAERGDWSGMVAIAGDDDKWTAENTGKNPGRECADRAAKAIGCGVAIPICEGTDWNDYFVERLEKIEAAPDRERWKPTAQSMRSAALAPIAAAMLRACKMIEKK